MATSWKTDIPLLPNNYEMACSRLRNTGKHLTRQLQWLKITSGLSPPTLTKGTSAKSNPPRTGRKASGTFLNSQYVVLRGLQQRQESYLTLELNSRVRLLIITSCQVPSYMQVCLMSFFVSAISHLLLAVSLRNLLTDKYSATRPSEVQLIAILAYTNLNVSCLETHPVRFVPNSCLKTMSGSMTTNFHLQPRQ